MNRHVWHCPSLAPAKPCVNVSRNVLVVCDTAFQKLLRLLVNHHTGLHEKDEKGFNSTNLILQVVCFFKGHLFLTPEVHFCGYRLVLQGASGCHCK